MTTRVPRNLDRLNWRDHRPLDNPQGGPPRGRLGWGMRQRFI